MGTQYAFETFEGGSGLNIGLGRITDRTETITIPPASPETTTRHFEYDDAGRLWRVCDDDTCSNVLAEYLYDASGNRNDGSIGSDSISAVVDDQDRLLSYTLGATTHTYTYSENGELESKTNTDTSATTTYSYDAFGNLRTVVLPDATEIEYLIDGRNRRVGKKVNGTLVQQFLYKDQLNPVAELDGSGNLVAQFVYGSKSHVPDYVMKYGVDAGTYRIISDHLGSPRFVIDTADGSVVQQMNFDAFGNVLQDTNPEFQPFGFAGGVRDSTIGLIRFGARDYDPSLTRWTSKDPIGFATYDTNLYGYAFNDPVNFFDSTGRGPLEALGAGVACEAVLVVNTITGLHETFAKDLVETIANLEHVKRLLESERDKCQPGSPEWQTFEQKATELKQAALEVIAEQGFNASMTFTSLGGHATCLVIAVPFVFIPAP